MEKELGLEWDAVWSTINTYGGAYKLSNNYGSFYVTREASYAHPVIADDFYKYVSEIASVSLANKSYFVCVEKEKENYFAQLSSNYIIVTWADLRDCFPNTLENKLNRIVYNLFHINPDIGGKIEDYKLTTYFSKSLEEFLYLIDILVEKGIVKANYDRYVNGSIRFQNGIILAEKGWQIVENEINKIDDKQVFIAMWFNDSVNDAFIKIYQTISECGFHPLRIDNKEHNNEISGEILYEIKRSSFIVADVTGQRHGVYFEAGFALGNKIPVIWTCREDEKDRIHFDTRQYNHIIWSNEDELYKKLVSRIKGTILIES